MFIRKGEVFLSGHHHHQLHRHQLHRQEVPTLCDCTCANVVVRSSSDDEDLPQKDCIFRRIRIISLRDTPAWKPFARIVYPSVLNAANSESGIVSPGQSHFFARTGAVHSRSPGFVVVTTASVACVRQWIKQQLWLIWTPTTPSMDHISYGSQPPKTKSVRNGVAMGDDDERNLGANNVPASAASKGKPFLQRPRKKKRKRDADYSSSDEEETVQRNHKKHNQQQKQCHSGEKRPGTKAAASQYRDRARERREGRVVEEDTSALPFVSEATTLTDVLFEAATTAVEDRSIDVAGDQSTHQQSSEDRHASTENQEEQQHDNFYRSRSRRLDTLEQVRDWLLENSNNKNDGENTKRKDEIRKNYRPPPPTTPLAQSIVSWLQARIQQNPKQKEQEAVAVPSVSAASSTTANRTAVVYAIPHPMSSSNMNIWEPPKTTNDLGDNNNMTMEDDNNTDRTLCCYPRLPEFPWQSVLDGITFSRHHMEVTTPPGVGQSKHGGNTTTEDVEDIFVLNDDDEDDGHENDGEDSLPEDDKRKSTDDDPTPPSNPFAVAWKTATTTKSSSSAVPRNRPTSADEKDPMSPVEGSCDDGKPTTLREQALSSSFMMDDTLLYCGCADDEDDNYSKSKKKKTKGHKKKKKKTDDDSD